MLPKFVSTIRFSYIKPKYFTFFVYSYSPSLSSGLESYYNFIFKKHVYEVENILFGY